MALPLTMTLGQLRDEVLKRCGYSTDGNQSAAVTPMVDSMIAGSEREIFSEFQWLNAMKRLSIPIEEDEAVVDWPDESEPGEITDMWVVKASNGELSQVMPGILLNERDTADNGESGQPLLYEFMDQAITLKPAPSADFTEIVVTYKLRPSLVEEEDYCLVDAELLIQHAVMKFKEYLGMPIGQLEAANHERYMARLRSANAQRNGWVIGGHKSWRTDVQKRNRIAKNGRGSSWAVSTDFNPW